MFLVPRNMSGQHWFDEMLPFPSTMKTDIREQDGNYLLAMDIPGYSKENIHVQLEDGYLTVTASTSEQNQKQDDKGHYLYQERYTGQCARSFYVGDNI